MKAIILARVSTKEQEEGHSIDAQVTRLQEYCQRKEMKVLEVFKIIESSTQGNRKEFHEMLEFAKSQKEIVAIVCDAVDRFQRSFKETVLLDGYRNEGVIELHFNREGLIINKTSPGTQILQWNMAVLMANAYVLSLSDNVKRSINHKVKNGEWIGKAPVGYINTKHPSTGKSQITVAKEKGYIVKRLFEEFGQGGRSVREMAALAKQWGLVTHKGKSLTHSNVHELLQNPFYYGAMRVKGEVKPASHEPLISKALFDRCQEIRTGWHKKPFKYSDKQFTFRGLIKCDHCGCTISSDRKKGKYVYLSCSKSKGPCEGRRIREEVALEQIQEAFRSFQIPIPILEAIKDHLNQSAQNKKVYHQEAIKRITRDYDLIQMKLENLVDLRLEGRITPDHYDKKCSQLKDKQHSLAEELKAHTDADEKFNITLFTLLDLTARAYNLFLSSKPEQKRQLINLTLSNLKLNKATLGYTIRKPFQLFTERASCSEMLRLQDSNLRPSG